MTPYLIKKGFLMKHDKELTKIIDTYEDLNIPHN